MAVSSSGKLVCLGGKDKLAVFEDKNPHSDSSQYKGIIPYYLVNNICNKEIVCSMLVEG